MSGELEGQVLWGDVAWSAGGTKEKGRTRNQQGMG